MRIRQGIGVFKMTDRELHNLDGHVYCAVRVTVCRAALPAVFVEENSLDLRFPALSVDRSLGRNHFEPQDIHPERARQIIKSIDRADFHWETGKPGSAIYLIGYALESGSKGNA